MESRWSSESVLKRFQALVNILVIFSETCGKTKHKPEFENIKIPLLSAMNLLFKEEMPDNADQMVASLSTGIFQTLKSIGSKKIGGENNIEFINTLMEATREQVLFRNACEDEISKINSKRSGYDLILMSDHDFKKIDFELNKKPILAWDRDGNYNLWGCDSQGDWKITPIDNKKMSVMDQKELNDAREKMSIVFNNELLNVREIGLIFVKPLTSLFNTLLVGHCHHSNKKVLALVNTQKLIQEEKEFMQELIIAAREARKNIESDQQKMDENDDEMVIELDEKESDPAPQRIGALTHLDTKEELLKKIHSIGLMQVQSFSPLSLFKRAASYYPKAIAAGSSLNLVGLGIGGLNFLSTYLGQALDVLIHADQTGMTHETIVALALVAVGTTITVVTLAKSSDCASADENEWAEIPMLQP